MASSVQLPVAAPGRLTCDIHLATAEDTRLFIEKLREATQILIKQRASGSVPVTNAAAGAPAPTPVAAPVVAAPSLPPPVAAAPPAPPAPSAAAPAPATGAASGPLQAAPLLFAGMAPAAAVAAAAAPQRLASAATATAAPVPPPAAPPPARAAAAPPPQQPQTQTQPRPAATAAAPPPARASAPATAGPPPHTAAASAAAGPSWQLCWTTEAADHNSEPVSSMVYLPAIAGLPGGEGHAGWLVSSSRGLLNLWEASPSGGRGEAALMCMHSQGTDYSSVCLDAERGTRMLLSASMDRSGGEWVTAHSLEVDTLLAPKGRCPMPHSAASKISGQHCLAVASLHGFGGPLAETCVASYGGALVVWPIGNASKPAASNAATPGSMAPRAIWKAHDSLITSLHKSGFGLSLFSGAADGKVHMFNMREKPSQPQAVFAQQGRITGIRQINDSQLLTTAGDGRLMVWDLRNAAAGPLKFAVPDSRPIVRMAVSPFADSVAVATTAGIFQVDLLDSACSVTPILAGTAAAAGGAGAGALRCPISALTWNAATSEVVAAGGPGGPGTISVFKPRLAF